MPRCPELSKSGLCRSGLRPDLFSSWLLRPRSLCCLPLHLCWRGSPPARSTPASMGDSVKRRQLGPFLDTAGCAVGGAGFRATGAPAPRLWSGGEAPLSAVSGTGLPAVCAHPAPPATPAAQGLPSLPAGGSPTGAVLGNFRGLQWSTSLSLQRRQARRPSATWSQAPPGPRLPVCERGARVAVTLGPRKAVDEPVAGPRAVRGPPGRDARPVMLQCRPAEEFNRAPGPEGCAAVHPTPPCGSSTQPPSPGREALPG